VTRESEVGSLGCPDTPAFPSLLLASVALFISPLFPQMRSLLLYFKAIKNKIDLTYLKCDINGISFPLSGSKSK
jgi:hypothetical protein